MAEGKSVAGIVLNVLALLGALPASILLVLAATSATPRASEDSVLLLVIIAVSLALVAAPVTGIVLWKKNRATRSLVVGIASAVFVFLSWIVIPAVIFGLSGA